MPYRALHRLGQFPSLEAFFHAMQTTDPAVHRGGVLLVHPASVRHLTAAKYLELAARARALGLELEFTPRVNGVKIRMPASA